MTDTESKLLALLKDRSLQLGDFELASGDRSTYYIDGRMSLVHSEGARLLGEVIYERTCGLDFDALGGLEVGAVPLTTAAVISYSLHDKEMEGFWVRSKVKQHGTKKRVEGKLEPGSRVVILDDVITRGNSALEAVQAARELDCEIVRVLAIVDRLAGAAELFAEAGIDQFESVFTIRDFGVEPNASTTSSA